MQPDYKPPPAEIISFVSGKGGVGKTTLVSNIGIALVKRFKKKVLVVDTCFSSPTLGLHLGILYPSSTIHDILENRVPVEEAIYAHSSGLHIMPASLSAKRGEVDYNRLRAKLSQVADNYDYILLDGSAGVDEETKATIKASDRVVVVTNPDIPAITSAIKVLETIKDFGIDIAGIILNKIRGSEYEATAREIEGSTDEKLIGTIRYDRLVPESISSSTPVVLYSPESDPSVSMIKIASAITGLPFTLPSRSIVSTLVESILGRKEKRERPSMEKIVRHLGEEAQKLPTAQKKEPVEVVYDDETKTAIEGVRKVIHALEDEYKEGILSAESYRELRKYNNEKLKAFLAKGIPIYEKPPAPGEPEAAEIEQPKSDMIKQLLDSLKEQYEGGILSEEDFKHLRAQALSVPHPSSTEQPEPKKKHHKRKKKKKHKPAYHAKRRR